MSDRSKNWSSQKKYIIEKIRNGEYSVFEDASPLRKKDKDIVIAAVTQWGNLLKHADDIWKTNKAIVMLAVTQFGGALHYASKELKADKEIVTIAVAQDGESLRDASEDLRGDQHIVLMAIKEDSSAIKYASPALQADKAFILAAVKANGQMLEYASDTFKADKDIVLAAVMQHGQAFKHAAEELRSQKDIIVAAVKKDGQLFDSTNDKWTSDREIMLMATSHDGNMFQYAADELKEDRSFVLEAVKVGGISLKYSSEALKRDKEVVQAAVAQNGSTLEYASSSLQADKEVVMTAVQQNGIVLEYASFDLKADEEVVMAAVAQCGTSLQHADEKWTSNIDIVRAAVKQDGKALRFASDDLKSNKMIAMEAVQGAGNALKYVDWDLRKDEDIVLSALSNESKAVRYVNGDFFTFGQIPKVFLDYLKNEKAGRAILHEWVDSKYLPDRLKSLVRQDHDIADVKNEDGKRAIDRAIPQCKEAMEIALRLFGLYDVIEGPLLHQNDTTCVFRADRYETVTTDDGADTKQQIPSVLKIIIGVEKVMAELNARKGLHHMDTSSVRPVKAVLVSSSLATDTAKYAALEDAAAKCGAILHPPIEGFMIQTYGAISDRLVTERQLQVANEDEAAALVFDFADRTLDAALRYDRIASGDRPHLVKQIAKAIAKALLELHENGYIHGDLKPLNIMRVGDRWKTTDLDTSCSIGGNYSEKKPSSGYCPPEIVEKIEDLKTMNASVAHDLWSFGSILYHLETGRSLWQLDQDDNIVQEQMYDMMHWKRPSVRRKKFARVTFSTVDAKELVMKLLDPDPVRRCAHFQNSNSEYYGHGEEMNLVLTDGYFDEDTKIFKALQSIQSDVSTIKEMSMTQEDELKKTRDILMHAIYEADEVQTPTTFVVLKKKLPPPLSPEEEDAMMNSSFLLNSTGLTVENICEKVASLMRLIRTIDGMSASIKDPILNKLQEIIDLISNEDLSNEDIKSELKNMLGKFIQFLNDSGINLDSDLTDILEQLKAYAPLLEGSGTSLEETMSQWKGQLDQANEWVADLTSVGKMITEADPEKFFGIVSNQFDGLLQGEFMYFYLVDELTGKPVRADGYPIEIQTPADFVPKVLPLIQVSMRAVSLVNGAAGVCQMFGFPVPTIPNVLQDQMNNSVEVMKMGSSVATFSAVHKKVEDNDGKTESVRGACLRELERFLKEHDENDTFAGLRRIGDIDGGAIWTILSDEEVKEQLEKRSKMREVEEHLQMEKLQGKIALEKMKKQNESKVVFQPSSQSMDVSNSKPNNGMHHKSSSNPELGQACTNSNAASSVTHNNLPTANGSGTSSNAASSVTRNNLPTATGSGTSSNAASSVTHNNLPTANGSGQELALIKKQDSTFFGRLLSPWSHLGGPAIDRRIETLTTENISLKQQLAAANAKMKQTSRDMKAAAEVIHQAANNMHNFENNHSDCVIS